MLNDKASGLRAVLLIAAGAVFMITPAGCGGGTQTGSPSDSGSDSSGAGGSGGSTGGAIAGNAGGGGQGGQGGQGGGIDGGGMDAPGDAQADAPLVNATITMLTPASISLGTGVASFTLTVDGRDFQPDAHVSFDHNLFPTTFVSSTRLQAEIVSAALGATPRQVNVVVSRLGTPALTSNAFPFDILAAQ